MFYWHQYLKLMRIASSWGSHPKHLSSAEFLHLFITIPDFWLLLSSSRIFSHIISKAAITLSQSFLHIHFPMNLCNVSFLCVIHGIGERATVHFSLSQIVKPQAFISLEFTKLSLTYINQYYRHWNNLCNVLWIQFLSLTVPAKNCVWRDKSTGFMRVRI